MNRSLLAAGLSAGFVAWALVAAVVTACPFCGAVSMTLSEELQTSDVAVIASLEEGPAGAAAPSTAPPKRKFKIVKVLKGQQVMANKPVVEMLYFGSDPVGTKFLIFAVDPQQLSWGTPLAVTDRGVEYLEKISQLPEASAARLAFFQDYFEDTDTQLASDAFNEFAKAPYADVLQLKGKMHHDKLVEWIKDNQVPTSRRRLYLTMLGACGEPADIPLIEQLINTEDRQVRTALDAMIGCYLSLKRADGLPLINEKFLRNKDAEYVDTYAAIVALRVLGQETDLISKDDLLASLELVLERPEMADIVVPDLARWQDWKVMPRLVELFKSTDESTSWVRVPIVQFLRACPVGDPQHAQAQAYIAELTAIDPDSVKRASNYLIMPGAAAAAGGTRPSGQKVAPASQEALAPAEKSPSAPSKARAAGGGGASVTEAKGGRASP